MRPLAVIGNLAEDVVEGLPPRIGGGPYYAARALRLLGTPARIVTKCAEADRASLLPPLEKLGLPVTWRAATSTARFSFRYEGDRRLMTVEELGDAWTPDEADGWVAEAIGPGGWIQVAPLSRVEFPAKTLAALARGRRVALDGQGLVRPGRTGLLELDADFDPALLRHVTVLKLADDEAVALVGSLDEDALLGLGVPELVVTLGSRGSLLLVDGRTERVPAHVLTGSVDPTGAGDAFSAAYVASRAAEQPPLVAAQRATALVAGLLSGRAP
jgi:sugar/nucleoside kinase (ribokinase family)